MKQLALFDGIGDGFGQQGAAQHERSACWREQGVTVVAGLE
jgi:hypothetical protein